MREIATLPITVRVNGTVTLRFKDLDDAFHAVADALTEFPVTVNGELVVALVKDNHTEYFFGETWFGSEDVVTLPA